MKKKYVTIDYLKRQFDNYSVKLLEIFRKNTDSYTKDETNELLDAKANNSIVYTQEQINGFLDEKANADDVYTTEEIDEKLANFVPSGGGGTTGDSGSSVDYEVLYITIDAEWSGSEAPYTKNVTVPGVTADSVVLVAPNPNIDEEKLEALGFGYIIGGTQSENTVQLLAYGEPPEEEIPLMFVVIQKGTGSGSTTVVGGIDPEEVQALIDAALEPVSEALDLKRNIADSYDKTEIDGKLALYRTVADSYTKAQIDAKFPTVSGLAVYNITCNSGQGFEVSFNEFPASFLLSLYKTSNNYGIQITHFHSLAMPNVVFLGREGTGTFFSDSTVNGNNYRYSGATTNMRICLIPLYNVKNVTKIS